MNAHQRRKRMRRYGRETGLDAIPFGLLRLADRGDWRQAEELRVSLGLPDPLEGLKRTWAWLWPEECPWWTRIQGIEPPSTGMEAYFRSMEYATWPRRNNTRHGIAGGYHRWRERREADR